MNGGWPPMLGGPFRSRAHQNDRVKKSPARSLRPALLSGTGIAASAAGFTLIEVLIALIVLVLGVLGAAGMTLNSLKDTKQSGLQSQATALAYELSELMRANPGQETSFTSGTQGSVSGCWSSGCSPSDMAKNDYYEWYTKLTGTYGLPNGSAVVCHDATKLADPTLACDNAATAPLVVKLKWDEKNNNARGQAASGAITSRILVVTIKPYL
jgi:type IV pilus assembly protein PilV